MDCDVHVDFDDHNYFDIHFDYNHNLVVVVADSCFVDIRIDMRVVAGIVVVVVDSLVADILDSLVDNLDMHFDYVVVVVEIHN